MTANPPNHENNSPEQESVGDQNVRRLLSDAYKPESIDPIFAKQVQERALTEATRVRESVEIHSLQNGALGVSNSGWMVAGSLALAIIILIGYVATVKPMPDYYQDGKIIWVKGQPYVAASEPVDVNDAKANSSLRKIRRNQVDPKLAEVDKLGMRPRARPAAIFEKAKSGDRIQTHKRERKRMTLEDGSQLFINENSEVQVEMNRQIFVRSGEVYVDVAPMEPTHEGATFLVKTPNRNISAFGTKFAVGVEDDQTEVTVTQGKVRVSAFDAYVHSGERFVASHETSGDEKAVSVAQPLRYLEWIRDLIAAGETPLVPASKFAGGALVAVDPNGQETKLSMRKYHVDVHIEDGFSRTTIDQTYFNHEQTRLEGTFYFPLPPDASISRLAMYVNGQLIEGGMVERNRARDVFETIKHRSLDPALLEWIDGSTFKMRVFPLEGRQEKRIILSYTQKLNSKFDRFEYRFPSGHNMKSVDDWSFKVHVEDGRQFDWESSSHQLEETRNGANIALAASSKNAKLDRDIVLKLTPRQDANPANSPVTRFSTFEQDGWQYLMMRYRPNLEIAKPVKRRDWVFLFESDGSRDPLIARVQVDIVRTMLKHAGHDDTFSIVTAGTRTHAFATKPTPINPEQVDEAMAFLESTHLIGAVDLEKALYAIRSYTNTVAEPTIVHLGSGVPILGERQTSQLIDLIDKDDSYVGIGVGKRWNRSFMKSAAEKSGGFFTQINPDEPTEWRTMELLSAIHSSRLLQVNVSDPQDTTEFFTFDESCVQGNEICAVTRLPISQDLQSLKVTGKWGGSPFEKVISVPATIDQAGYLPRFWAKLAIDKMVAENSEGHRSKIIELSKQMYVMSPFTSLLVLENEQMYAEFNVDRGRKDHWAIYPCPDKIQVVHEPINASDRNKMESAISNESKRSIEDVLRSLFIVVNQNRQNQPVYPGWTRFDSRFDGDDPFLDTSFFDSSFRHEVVESRLRLDLTDDFVFDARPSDPSSLVLFSDGLRIDQNMNGVVDPNADFDTLVELITTTIRPNSWIYETDEDETFTVSLDASARPDMTMEMINSLSPVVVRNYSQDAQNLQNFTDFLDSQLIPFPDDAPLVYPDAEVWSELTDRRQKYQFAGPFMKLRANYRKVENQLNAKIDVDFDEAPLRKILTTLSERHGIRLRLDESALKQESISADSVVSISLTQVKLRSVLTLMLEKLNLTFLVTGDGIEVTTGKGAEQFLFEQYIHDPLLLFSTEKRKAARLSVSDDLSGRFIGRLANALRSEISNPDANKLLYPDLTHRRGLTATPLLDFMPGCRTNSADILAALMEEAHLKRPIRRGEIDPRAKKLIDSVRKSDWKSISRKRKAPNPSYNVIANGRGQFRLDRITVEGLMETVVNDGSKLKHLYREMGLGTTRQFNRFHNSFLEDLVPWYLPSVEDLSQGCDLRLVGPQTVAIVPHWHTANESEKSARRKLRTHLVFGSNGRLRERQVVEMPTGSVVAKIVFTSDYQVKWYRDSQLIRSVQFEVESAGRPDLNPDVKELVILPMPGRDQHVIRQKVAAQFPHPHDEMKGNPLMEIVDNEVRGKQHDPVSWKEEQALKLVVSLLSQNPDQVQDLIGRRFFANEDRRIGFYVLLLAAGHHGDNREEIQLSDGSMIKMSPVADHPNSLLAKFVASHCRNSSNTTDWLAELKDENNRFIAQLASFKMLCAKWHPDVELPTHPQIRNEFFEQTFEFIKRSRSIRFSYSVLRQVQRRLGEKQPQGRIAEAILGLEQKGVKCYTAKYELARSLAIAGNRKQSTRLFVALYQEAIDCGFLPPIDRSYVRAISNYRFGDYGKGIRALMLQTTDRLIEQNQRHVAMTLANQCRQLNQKNIANELVDRALAGIKNGEQFRVKLEATRYFLQTAQYDRANSIIHALLQYDPIADSAAMWRLAAEVATKRGWLASSLSCLERAVDLELSQLPASYHVNSVRAKYVELFQKFAELGRINALPNSRSSYHLIGRAMSAADRWRMLDSDITQACQSMSDLLENAGHVELAWDYLTTPLALKPNEPMAWLKLAKNQQSKRNIAMAGRAYAMAFEAESTNAHILWDHAQMLDRHGRADDAQKIYGKIASGTWQPRFDWIKRHAEKLNSGAHPTAE